MFLLRYFLKSDSIEWKHIVEEFIRVALVHPEIEMILEHNEEVEMHLPIGSLRQRIVKIMGAKFQDWLVPIEEETHWLRIKGFVVKPEGAKKSRGISIFLSITDSLRTAICITLYRPSLVQIFLMVILPDILSNWNWIRV